MKSFWKLLPAWLRPSATGTIVFAWLVALQACLGTSSGTGTVGPGGVYETTSSRSMGWPPSVVVTGKTTADGVTRNAVNVRWAPLLCMGGLTYCLAMATGCLAMRNGRRRHPAKFLLAAIGVTLVLAFLAAINVSKGMWGYYLHRPSLDRRIVNPRRVLSVTVVKTAAGTTERTLVPDTSV
jgi:hypothetical protein